MIDLGSAATLLKLPLKIIAAISIASAVLLIAGDRALEVLGLKTLVAGFRPYIGGAFVITICIVAVTTMSALGSVIVPRMSEATWVRRHRKRLHDLTPDEKEILAGYVLNQTRSQTLPIQSGVVGSLAGEKIIVRASSLGSADGFAHVIQPWAWKYLNQHPELLE
jgi:hypothetical protein